MVGFTMHLPPQVVEQWKLTPVVEARERFQRRVNKAFSESVNDNRSDFEQRYRVGFDFRNGKDVSGKLRWQYAHNLIWTNKRNSSDMSSDLMLGELDLKAPRGVVQLGRQIIRKGSQRLFEESQFGQRSKTFDVARYIGQGADVFVGKAGYTPNRSDQARLFGASYQWKAGETFVVYKYDRWVTKQDFWTFDHRITKSWKGLTFDIEGAVQNGRVNGKDLDGWMLTSRVTKTFNKKWSAYVEADAFSGGQNSEKQHRFEPLYGATHSYYGLADVQGPQNVNDFELGVTYKPNSRLQLTGIFNVFQLRDSRDGWYGTSADSINSGAHGKFIDSTGKAGRDVAQEFDLQARFALGKHDGLAMELALIRPGRFISNLNGAGTKNQLWGFLAYEVKF